MDKDLRFLSEAVSHLQDYVLADKLYATLSMDLPQLSLGAVLLALTRTGALHPAEAQKFRVQVETLKAKWRTAWEQKAALEMANRLRLWSQFLSDAFHDAGKEKGYYTSEVRGRVILQLLLKETPNVPEKATLDELDAALGNRFAPGAFVWEKELEAVFPAQEFWFLYGRFKA